MAARTVDLLDTDTSVKSGGPFALEMEITETLISDTEIHSPVVFDWNVFTT